MRDEAVGADRRDGHSVQGGQLANPAPAGIEHERIAVHVLQQPLDRVEAERLCARELVFPRRPRESLNALRGRRRQPPLHDPDLHALAGVPRTSAIASPTAPLPPGLSSTRSAAASASGAASAGASPSPAASSAGASRGESPTKPTYCS